MKAVEINQTGAPEVINLKDISLEQSLKMLKQMIEIRKAEEEIVEN